VDEVDREQPPDLLGDRGEQSLVRHPACHQSCDAPQRCLLLGQPGETTAALGVRDRRRHEVRELGEARLDVRR
jgi:hypothetical protein